MALAGVVIAGVIAVVMMSQRSAPTWPAPLVLPMTLAGSNATFAVYPDSSGAVFRMPDGSLWLWGNNVTNSERQPEVFDDQHHWAKVFNRSGKWMPQDINGHVWETRWRLSPLVPSPLTNRDWAELTGGFMYTLGLQRDGSILGWEDGRTNIMAPVQTNLHWRTISANAQ